MEYLEKLQAPGLILAGLVIWWLFKLLADRDKLISSLQAEVAESNKILVKIATLMDLIFRKSGQGGGK